MSMPSIEMNTGDLEPVLIVNLTNSDGSQFNLTGCSVAFQLWQQGVMLFSKPCTILNGSAGQVQYTWALGDTAYFGVCTGIFVVTISGGGNQSFPSVGDFYVIFPLQPLTSPTVPAYTTFNQVVSHLNVKGPDLTGNYTIYGLPVSQQAIQARVDHANLYLISLVPSLTSMDPRYPFAQLAALDMACVGVLVTASGGMLLGATDYKLGDLFVTRGTIGKFALESSVQSYQDSFARNVMNLSTVALGTKAVLGFRVPHKEPYFF